MCPTHSQAKQTETSEFVEEKGHARRGLAHALKSPELPDGFRQSTFKSQVGLRLYFCPARRFIRTNFFLDSIYMC